MSFDIKNLIDVYEFETTLPGSGEVVKFRPITTGQMKKLLVYEQENQADKIEEALDDLINGCVINEGFNVKNLYLQDRFFLLVEIRKRTKGDAYTFQFKCPECQTEGINTVNLDELPCTKLDIGDNVVEATSKLKVAFRHPTRADQIEAYRLTNAKGEQGFASKAADVVMFTYAFSMEKFYEDDKEIPSSEVPLEDRIFLLEHMHDDNFEKVKKWFADTNFGLDFTFDINCPKGHNKKYSIPIASFFD